MNRVCAFTGHRNLPQNKLKNIIIKLNEEIDKALYKNCHHFISGGAAGIDVIAARIVTEKIDYDKSITLSLMLPYKDFINKYDFSYLQPYCKNISYTMESYHISAYTKRDEEIVDKADMLIAFYDGREKGGTYYTIKYAEKKGIEVVLVNINDIPEDN